MSDEDIVEQVKRAVEIVENADVPTDLRAAVYESVWREIAGTSNGGIRATTEEPPKKDSVEPGSLGVLASKLGIEPGIVAEIYQEAADGSLTLHIPSTRLSDAKGAATKEIALLVCAAEYAQGREWTASKTIVDICREYGKFDQSHNAEFMTENDALWMIQGTGRGREFKLRRPGWEATTELVRAFVAE